MLAVDRAADPEGLQLREQQHAGRCRAHAQPCGRFGAGRAADRLTRARRARLCFAMRPWCCCSAGGSGGRSWSRGGSRKPVLNERLLAGCRRRRRRLRRWWWGRGRAPPPAKAPVQQRALVFYTCPSRPLRPPSDAMGLGLSCRWCSWWCRTCGSPTCSSGRSSPCQCATSSPCLQPRRRG